MASSSIHETARILGFFFILFCFLFECNASKLEPILAFKQLV